MARRLVLAAVAAWLPLLALAQGGAPDCSGELDENQATQLRQCEGHAPCRQVLRLMSSCESQRRFAGRLSDAGGAGSEGSLRRALVESGVPAAGLQHCTVSFNRALCSQFLGVANEPGSAPARAEMARAPVLQAEARRLSEQADRARQPADAHRFAQLKLGMCQQTQNLTLRQTHCQEAEAAVQGCQSFREEWIKRRAAVQAEAESAGLSAVLKLMPKAEIVACAVALPNGQTPAQALEQIAADLRNAPPAPAPTPATPPPVAAGAAAAAVAGGAAAAGAAGATGAAAAAGAAGATGAAAGSAAVRPAALDNAQAPRREPPGGAAAPAAVPAAGGAAGAAAAGTPAAAGAAGGAAVPANARSLCMRHLAKIEDVVRASGAPFSGRGNDGVVMQLARLRQRLLEPCAPWDAAARAEAEKQRAQADRIARFCAGEVPVNECAPYGEREAENRRYFQLWRAELNKALAAPDYSADLGPARMAP